MPALAASHAASILVTTSRGCAVTSKSLPSRTNFHTYGPRNPLMDDAIVPSEILGRLGRTAGLEIGGAGAHDATDGADPQRDQSAVEEFAGPERHIDMFVRQAEDSVPEQQ